MTVKRKPIVNAFSKSKTEFVFLFFVLRSSLAPYCHVSILSTFHRFSIQAKIGVITAQKGPNRHLFPGAKSHFSLKYTAFYLLSVARLLVMALIELNLYYDRD